MDNGMPIFESTCMELATKFCGHGFASLILSSEINMPSAQHLTRSNPIFFRVSGGTL
jgi:hypothetical protein